MTSCDRDEGACAVPRTEELPLGGSLRLLPNYVSQPETACSRLTSAFSFEERAITLFGKQILQPRLISWAGTLPYTYSGDTLAPRPIPDVVQPLLERVNATVAKLDPQAPPFNHVLANLYRDGKDSMGLHSDDEHELGPEPWVASISLGAERCFQIAAKRKYRDKGRPSDKLNLLLPSGSLLLMQPPMQRYYLHGLQKTKRTIGPRLNLTFRAVVG